MGACMQQQAYCSYKNTDVFSTHTFRLLESLMNTKKVDKDHFLFLNSDKNDRLFYVKKGQIKISKVTEDGKELVLYIFQQGDLIGELGISSNSQYSYTAKVTMPSEVGVLQQKDLECLIRNNGDFAVDFMKWLSNMHALTRSKFRDLMLYGKKGALCSTLLRLANSFGIMTEDGILITQHFTNTDIAELIGTSRETINRLLAQLKKDGVITYIGIEGKIKINKLQELKSACHCEDCPLEICRI